MPWVKIAFGVFRRFEAALPVSSMPEKNEICTKLFCILFLFFNIKTNTLSRFPLFQMAIDFTMKIYIYFLPFSHGWGDGNALFFFFPAGLGLGWTVLLA